MKENYPGLAVTSGPCLNCNIVNSDLKNGYCEDCRKRFGLGTRKQAMDIWEANNPSEQVEENIEDKEKTRTETTESVEDLVEESSSEEE